MAHFLCGERRAFPRPDERNMGCARQDAKATEDEISVMSAPRTKKPRENFPRGSYFVKESLASARRRIRA
jgi:hypothetical protein